MLSTWFSLVYLSLKPVTLSVCLSVCLPDYLCLSVYLTMCLFVNLTDWVCICLSVCFSIYLSAHLTFRLFVRLTDWLSIGLLVFPPDKRLIIFSNFQVDDGQLGVSLTQRHSLSAWLSQTVCLSVCPSDCQLFSSSLRFLATYQSWEHHPCT